MIRNGCLDCSSYPKARAPRISRTKGTIRRRGTRLAKLGRARIEDGFVTYDQDELLRYFAERHRQRERLELIEVSSTQAGLLGEKNNVGIVYVLTRDAEVLEPGLGGQARIAFGKGAINCENRQIFAWSMEMRVGETRSEREAAAGLCTDPPGWKPGTAVVACA